MSTAALVLGITGLFFSFFGFGIILAVLAVIFSVVSLKKKKNGMAIAGLICGIIGILISVVVIAATPSTQGTASGSEKADDHTAGSSERKSDQIKDLSDEMSVKVYTLPEDGSLHAVLVVTNNSDKTVSLDANMTIKDASGNAIGAQDSDASPVEPGKKAILEAYYDDAENFDSLDYKLNVSAVADSTSLAKNIDLKINQNGKKVVLTATNNGKAPAYFLEAEALFLKDGKMIGDGSTYLVDDDDSSIKPGETISGEIESYAETDPDDVIVTYTARDD